MEAALPQSGYSSVGVPGGPLLLLLLCRPTDGRSTAGKTIFCFASPLLLPAATEHNPFLPFLLLVPLAQKLLLFLFRTSPLSVESGLPKHVSPFERRRWKEAPPPRVLLPTADFTLTGEERLLFLEELPPHEATAALASLLLLLFLSVLISFSSSHFPTAFFAPFG